MTGLEQPLFGPRPALSPVSARVLGTTAGVKTGAAKDEITNAFTSVGRSTHY
jgi:hypothetical protein